MDLFAFLSNTRTLKQKLEDAVCQNNLEELNKLLEDGLDPNTPLHKHGGDTAIHMAATYGNYLCIKQLVIHGAKADSPNHLGITPLFCAARSKHPRAMQMLLQMCEHVFEFDNIWANRRWADLLCTQAEESVLSTLITATPDINQLRPNLKSNLFKICTEGNQFRNLKLLLLMGNFRGDEFVKTYLEQLINDPNISSEKSKAAFTVWYKNILKKPHSLQQSCVLAIRRSFNGNCNVYYGVNQTELPLTLKSDVLFVHVT